MGETETRTDNVTKETAKSSEQTSSEVVGKDSIDNSINQTITTCAKITEQGVVVPPLAGDGSVTLTSLEQTVSQQVSVTNGQQEVTSTAKSSQQAVVKHSKKSRGKKGARGSTEQTVVQHMSKAEGRQEIVTKSRMQGVAAVQQSSVVQKTTDRSHEAKSSKSSEQTVVQRVGKNGRKQEMTITTTASSQESFYHVTTVKTVKTSSKSKVTKKR